MKNKTKIFLILFFLCEINKQIFCKEPYYGKLTDQIVSEYLQENSLKKGIYLTGYGGSFLNDVKKVTLYLEANYAFNVDEARKFYVEIMEELLTKFNQNEKIKPYLHNFPFNINNIGLSISFDDSEGNRQGNGRVAFMCLGREDKICYSKYNFETKMLENICRENYYEALQIVQRQNSQGCLP